MLRLTLRSRRDGRLQARIVDRDGVLFVLDFGDPAMLTDASRRVLHGGFTVSWQGVDETATPGNPALFRQLALYYAAQGFLVCVDEPDWPRPAFVDPIDAPSRLALTFGPPTLLPDEPGNEPESTEILSLHDVKRVLARVANPPPPGPPTLLPPVLTLDFDFEDGDEVTEEVHWKPKRD